MHAPTDPNAPMFDTGIGRPGCRVDTAMRAPGLSPETRSVLLAAIGGMMAAAYLDSREFVDLSFGFPSGGLVEGALIATIGALAGYSVLKVFRKLRDLAARDKK